MKLRVFLTFGALILCVLLVTGAKGGRKEEDDFAEFDDDFDEDEFSRVKGQNKKVDSPPIREKVSAGASVPKAKEEQKEKDPVELEEDEFEDDLDVEVEARDIQRESDRRAAEESSRGAEDEADVEDEDFDGMDDDEFDDEDSGSKKKNLPPPKLTITSVPMPMRGWQGYWAELLMIGGILVYMLNYVMGRYKNQKIAQSFFEVNWSILDDNFTLLGDSSNLEDDQGVRNYQKVSDSIFQMWCSGRVCCEGMLVELKLLKRQDLVSVLANIFRPAKDVLRVSVEMGKEDMDSLVCAVATKKTAVKITKEYNDLSNYCPDRKPGDKFGLPSGLVVMAEMGEVAQSFLDSKTISVINKFADNVDCIHVTDQFTGLKTAEPEPGKDLKPPEARRFLLFTLNLGITSTGNNAEDVFEDLKPFFQFIFYTIDRMKRIRLSREGKAKAEKNRAKIEEAFLKQTHVARAEAAAQRREDKRRQEKERILQEEDPEKQRRWEEKEQKREKKRKQPKMKQLKVKAM